MREPVFFCFFQLFNAFYSNSLVIYYNPIFNTLNNNKMIEI